MIGPWSFVSTLPAVFLLLTTLPGILEAKTHRCLLEFEPSNCNALEEVWAFDADGRRCIEMVYGGCGKPKRLSNRFETHEECMRSCEGLVRGSALWQITHRRDLVKGNSIGGHEKHKRKMRREFSGFLTVENDNPETAEIPVKDDESAFENIRSVLNYLSQESEGPSTSVRNAGQNRPVYERTRGQYVQPFGIGQGFNIGQEPVNGGIQRPFYGGQPRGQQSFANVQPLYGDQLRDSFHAHGPLQSNPASLDGAQTLYEIPIEPYPVVQTMPRGIPHWWLRRYAKK